MVKDFFQYKVSDDGHIYLPSGREVSYYKAASCLTCAMKIPDHYRNTFTVGEVVYAVFGTDVPNDFWVHRYKYIIRHIDGDPLNNRVSNLKLTIKKGIK